MKGIARKALLAAGVGAMLLGQPPVAKSEGLAMVAPVFYFTCGTIAGGRTPDVDSKHGSRTYSRDFDTEGYGKVSVNCVVGNYSNKLLKMGVERNSAANERPEEENSLCRAVSTHKTPGAYTIGDTFGYECNGGIANPPTLEIDKKTERASEGMQNHIRHTRMALRQVYKMNSVAEAFGGGSGGPYNVPLKLMEINWDSFWKKKK